MKVICKIVSVVTILSIASIFSPQILAVEIIGGGGSAAEKLILDWANSKLGNRANKVKFNSSNALDDLSLLHDGKIDFVILDAPLSETELDKMNLRQIPFALSGISIVVNLQNTMAGVLKLDSATLGKIFSGEITNWDDSAISSLNPKHDLPNKPISLIHSGELSTDYSLINSYIGSINEKWKTGDLKGKKRDWPANSTYADGFSARISAIKKNPFSIAYLPLQYMPQPALSAVHIKNKDGNFVGLTDIGVIASASTITIEERQPTNLSLINKNGSTSWPISTFSFVVVNRDKMRDEKIVQLLSVISYGLKTDTLKPTIHSYIALPEQISKPLLAKIEAFYNGTIGNSTVKLSPAKTTPEITQEAIPSKKRNDGELRRQATDPNIAAQEESRRSEEKSRSTKAITDEIAREQLIKEARASKLAAEEAIKAANAIKFQAEQLVEKNRLIAKAEKDKADAEKAEKEKVEADKAERERAIQLRKQKDEDPLEAYRRSVSR